MISSPAPSFVHTPPQPGLSGWAGHPAGAVSQPRAHQDGFSEPISSSSLPCPWEDEAPPVMSSTGLTPLHCCRAGASWTPVQNDLLLLLDHILKVTGGARQGETNVCHLGGPRGHVHTPSLATPREIIPLEGTGSRFSIPLS